MTLKSSYRSRGRLHVNRRGAFVDSSNYVVSFESVRGSLGHFCSDVLRNVALLGDFDPAERT